MGVCLEVPGESESPREHMTKAAEQWKNKLLGRVLQQSSEFQ